MNKDIITFRTDTIILDSYLLTFIDIERTKLQIGIYCHIAIIFCLFVCVGGGGARACVRACVRATMLPPDGTGSIHRYIVTHTSLYCIQYPYRDTIRYDTIRYDTIRYDTIRYDTIRYDTIRYDTIRYDTIHDRRRENSIRATFVKQQTFSSSNYSCLRIGLTSSCNMYYMYIL